MPVYGLLACVVPVSYTHLDVYKRQRLRGTNTIGGANTAPLVLIDGIPGELGTVAPEDVESVDVLKDGSEMCIRDRAGEVSCTVPICRKM